MDLVLNTITGWTYLVAIPGGLVAMLVMALSQPRELRGKRLAAFVEDNPFGIANVLPLMFAGFISACGMHHILVGRGQGGDAMLVVDGIMAAVTVATAVVLWCAVLAYGWSTVREKGAATMAVAEHERVRLSLDRLSASQQFGSDNLRRLDEVEAALHRKYGGGLVTGGIESPLEAEDAGWAVVVPHDGGWAYVAINLLLAEMNGAPAEDHIGATVHDLWPDLAPVAYEIFEEVVETKASVTKSFRAATAGERAWTVTYAPLLAKRGAEVIGITALVRETE